jgi:hypothetical protein
MHEPKLALGRARQCQRKRVGGNIVDENAASGFVGRGVGFWIVSQRLESD